MLGGEAGIGTTTLWKAGADLARELGLRVLVARPSGAEARLSFAALIDLFEGVTCPVAPAPGGACTRPRPAGRLPCGTAVCHTRQPSGGRGGYPSPLDRVLPDVPFVHARRLSRTSEPTQALGLALPYQRSRVSSMRRPSGAIAGSALSN